MPTKKNNVSLKQDDIEIVKQLRAIIENDGSRLSLAEVIRKCIQYSMNNKKHFEAYNHIHKL